MKVIVQRFAEYRYKTIQTSTNTVIKKQKPAMAAADQVPHPRAIAFEMAATMEMGEPHEDDAMKYMVRLTALDGGPVILCLSMGTTVGQINARLDDAYGVGAVYIAMTDGAEIGAGWRPIDVDGLGVEMVVMTRDIVED